MTVHSLSKCIILVCAGGMLAGCDSELPTPVEASSSHAHISTAAVDHAALNAALAELRRETARWHRLDLATSEDGGYVLAMGCIDERIVPGVAAADERGMGYHFANPALIFADPATGVPDLEVDLLTPELLVYAKHPVTGRMQLAGFDYFVPAGGIHGSPAEGGVPPMIAEIGVPFTWSPAHGGWMFHIWSWQHNPDGMFENFNSAVPMCDCELDELDFSCVAD